MSAHIGTHRLTTRLALVLAAGALCTAPATALQERDEREILEEKTQNFLVDKQVARRVALRDFRSDEVYVDLIERLEVGMSALAELGAGEALDLVRRVADELREERAAPRRTIEEQARPAQDDGLNSLEQRVKILRLARAAYAEAGSQPNAGALQRAIHYGELALEGANEKALGKAAEGVPSLGNLAELLGGAAGMYREWGNRKGAQACSDLSEYYVGRLREGEGEEEGEHEHGHEEEQEHEGERSSDIDRLEHRIEILHMAHAAWAESGRRELAGMMEQFIKVAELQLAGAPSTDVAQAFEGLSMGNVIELLQGAHNLYAEWGDMERAQVCRQLAQYYAERERGREGADEEREPQERERRARLLEDPYAERERGREGAEEEREPQGRGLEDLANRIPILRMARAAHAEAGHGEAAELMERILHLAELQLEGAGDEAISQASEGINQEMIIDLVQGARELYTEWGNQERAAASRQLVEYYLGRAREGGEERERRGGLNLEDKEQRVELLHLALAAHKEAGHGDAADLLERTIHLSMLQLEGASEEAIAQAAEGLSMEMIVELVQRAAHLYDEWGNGDRAEMLEALVRFYRERDGGGEERAEGAERAERERGEARERAEARERDVERERGEARERAGGREREVQRRRAEARERDVQRERRAAREREQAAGAGQAQIRRLLQRVERLQEELQEIAAALRGLLRDK